MLLEIHILQNFPPSNLNRDDLGSPKSAQFGGYPRIRISSQCLKHMIRCSPIFRQLLKAADFAIRSRKIPEEIYKALLQRKIAEPIAKAAAMQVNSLATSEKKAVKVEETPSSSAEGDDPEGDPRPSKKGSKKKGSKGENGKDTLTTSQLIYLTSTEIDQIIKVIVPVIKDYTDPSEVQISLPNLLKPYLDTFRHQAYPVDMALFGRMITSTAIHDVEGAMQVANAIATHRSVIEKDYFTTLDDLATPDEHQTAMIGDREFASATFYLYYNLDLTQLMQNLALTPETMDGQIMTIVNAFLKTIMATYPAGSQHQYAANSPPDVMFVEVRPHQWALSYANAFLKPVYATQSRDLMEQSAAQLIDYANAMTTKLNPASLGRFWLTLRTSGFLAENQPENVTVCASLDDLQMQVSMLIQKHQQQLME